jgi:hypothetical protein
MRDMPGTSLRLGRDATNAQKTKAFIAKARAIHGRKYDYSRVRYKNVDTPVEVVCRKHGPFFPSPWNHVRAGAPTGCKLCSSARAGESRRAAHKRAFVAKARKIHGGKYDYSKTDYSHARAKLKIVCRKHGAFLQQADAHLRGQGCPRCGFKKRGDEQSSKAAQQFAANAKRVHGRKYDYSKAKYLRATKKVCIICKKHGEWRQIPSSHLAGRGCPKCAMEATARSLTHSRSAFLKEARAAHGRKYSYARGYTDKTTPVSITCKIHGKFEQSPISHVRGAGCPKCSLQRRADSQSMSHDEFVRKAQHIHGDRYEYPHKYQRSAELLTIRCPKHGTFKQRPDHHLSYVGCPRCKQSVGELKVERALTALGVEFFAQHRFPDCKDKRPLRFDFFVPRLNALIEFDGPQHFATPTYYYNAEVHFVDVQRRDRIKTAYARKKKIRLIRVKYSVRDVEAFLVKALGLAVPC